MDFVDYDKKVARKREVGFVIFENRMKDRAIIVSRLQRGRYEAKTVQFLEYPSLKALVQDQHEKGFLPVVTHALREEMKKSK